LTTIVHQKAAYKMVMADLQIIEQTSVTGRISKEDLANQTGPALQRLRQAAKLLHSRDLLKALSKFPKYRRKSEALSRDYLILFAKAEPTGEEIAGFIPAIAQEVQVPIDFLENAVGVTASYVIEGMGKSPVTFGAEMFRSVEPR
jgi:hypothetical protein